MEVLTSTPHRFAALTIFIFIVVGYKDKLHFITQTLHSAWSMKASVFELITKCMT